MLDSEMDGRAAEIERAICRGESNLVMLEQAELRAREDLDAALAFSLGRAAEDEQDFAEARRLFERASDLGSPGVRTRAELCVRTGLTSSDLLRSCEELALERLAIDHAPRMIADGPGADESLAAEARLRGLWGRR